MNDLSVIDRFTEVFTTYIDSGFGLLTGEVAYLTSVLVAIDITLAGLFWSSGQDVDVLAKLIRKVLYVGVFALLLNNWTMLSGVIFDSFTGLGLKATANSLSASDLLRPGFVAGTGFQAAWPLLKQAGSMLGFSTFFDNVVTVLVLLFAWAVVVLAFFILSVQLFITIVEFKLTCLAGFVLVPFALWNKTAFLAERVLGNVVGSGIKMMVLAVIVGIGTTLFSDFVSALQGQAPNLTQAMSLVLGAIALFGLGIFGPGIATGLTSGAPQLSAGAAIGTVGGLAAGTMAGAGLGFAAARMATGQGLSAIRAGAALGAGTSTAYELGKTGSGASGLAGVGAGLAGVAKAGAAMMGKSFQAASPGPIQAGMQAGRQAAWTATGGTPPASASMPIVARPASAPAWAERLRSEQRRRAQTHIAAQAIKDGDRSGSAANPDLQDRE